MFSSQMWVLLLLQLLSATFPLPSPTALVFPSAKLHEP